MNAPGRRAEEAAAAFLQKNGFEILARNFTVRGAEIDIVAREKGCIVFVEVKASFTRSAAHGAPRERVTPAKQRRIGMAALLYLQRYALYDTPVRFDVVEVFPQSIVLLRNAFAFQPPIEKN